MAEKGNWIQRLADGSEIYGQPLPGVPIVEIAGDRRVLIERHEGVIEYGTEKIRICVKFGTVCICGSNLKLKQMTRQQLIVSGQIDCVQLRRRCR